MKISAEGHHSLSEDREVVHQLVERRDVNRVLTVARAPADFWLSLNHGVPAVQGRFPEGDVQSVSVRAPQLLHGVLVSWLSRNIYI